MLWRATMLLNIDRMHIDQLILSMVHICVLVFLKFLSIVLLLKNENLFLWDE